MGGAPIISRRAAWRGRAAAGAASVGLAGLLTACAALPASFPLPDSVGASDIGLVEVRQAARPTELIAARGAPLDEALLRRARDRAEAPDGSETISAAATPFFFEARLGRAYLQAPESRALARGAPAARCPARGFAAGAPSPIRAAADAIAACRAALERAGAPATCGCQVLAVDDLLIADPAAFAYARAIPARVDFGAGRRATLVAEPEGGPPPADLAATPPISLEEADALARGAARLALIGPRGPEGVLDLAADGAAAFFIGDAAAPAATGRWTAAGFSRGRLTRSIDLRREDGRPLSITLGDAAR